MSTEPDLLTVSQVCRRIPGARGAARVHPATVVRWITAGCPGRDGCRVKLAATRAGSRWLIRPADLDAFFAALAAEPDPASVSPRSPATRSKEAETAGCKLEKMGA
jgi:hypothetical protein